MIVLRSFHVRFLFQDVITILMGLYKVKLLNDYAWKGYVNCRYYQLGKRAIGGD